MNAKYTINDVKSKIQEIIVLALNIEEEELEDSLVEKLGINSIDALEILLHIENDFEIEFDDEDLNAELIDSIDVLTKYVVDKLATQTQLTP